MINECVYVCDREMNGDAEDCNAKRNNSDKKMCVCMCVCVCETGTSNSHSANNWW